MITPHLFRLRWCRMAFTLPDYWLPRPAATLTPDLAYAFDQLVDNAQASDGVPCLPYSLNAPKWQFLCYLSEQRAFVLHGSPSGEIAIFEPRQSSDLHAFGAQKAIYAAADGIWPMFFAILDRQLHPGSIINACLRVEHPRGHIGEPHYFFSVQAEPLARNPWTPGWVYILPRDSFINEEVIPRGADTWVYIAQVASLQPVKPVARLWVEPMDFPFLAQVRPHVGERLAEYARVLEQGLPWPDERE